MEAPQDAVTRGRGGVTLEFRGGAGGPGGRGLKLCRESHLHPRDCQSLRAKTVSSRCWPPAQGRKLPSTPRDAPSPLSEGRRPPLIYPAFWRSKSSLSRLKLAGSHAGHERWRVGHGGEPGLERWGRSGGQSLREGHPCGSG